MTSEDKNRICPYCKEEVKADAIICKHCRSRITPEKPSHGGTCPFCKESIHFEAIKCKHCGAYVGPQGEGCADCGASKRVLQPPYHLKDMITTRRSPFANLRHMMPSSGPTRAPDAALERNPFGGPFSIFECQKTCDYLFSRCFELCGNDVYCMVDCIKQLRDCQGYCDIRVLEDW